MDETLQAQIASLDALPPDESVDAYDVALRQAYWDRKDVAATRAIARAGIRRAIALADDADDPDAADRFRGAAKTMAYNLASFTWPGWDERGVTLTRADVDDGRDAARLNLRLAIRLGRPDRALADAWWLIGAHAIAAGDWTSATDAFAEARTFAETAAEPARVAMLDAYAALVASLADPSESDRFDAALAMLRVDGPAYVDQLVTARAAFTRP